jgi:hypothetical protein
MASRVRFFLFAALVVAACGKGSSDDSSDGGSPDGGPGDDGNVPPTPPPGGEGGLDGDAASNAGLDADRDRLLATYLAFLKSNPSQTQSNGLSGATTTDVCDLWKKLDPSSQSVYLTLTHRMGGSKLGDDSSMLSHVVKVYRVAGGQNAKTSPPGSCGGGEYNRMIMSMDEPLHVALFAANKHQGAKQPNGKPDIADIPTNANAFWRDSHDIGGPHAPFDLSDETDNGAPRGQVQFFADANSPAAKEALNRLDLTTLIDGNALEMDQDYDCAHNSNPGCDYFAYGPSCLPQATKKGTDIYTANYGGFEPTWMPVGCK